MEVIDKNITYFLLIKSTNIDAKIKYTENNNYNIFEPPKQVYFAGGSNLILYQLHYR